VKKILIIAFTSTIGVTQKTSIHEIDGLTIRLELRMISTNILAESNVVLLEEIMIVEDGAIFEPMLTLAHDAVCSKSDISIVLDRIHRPSVRIEHY